MLNNFLNVDITDELYILNMNIRITSPKNKILKDRWEKQQIKKNNSYPFDNKLKKNKEIRTV